MESLSADQLKARAMPNYTTEEKLARKNAMRRANDKKYRETTYKEKPYDEHREYHKQWYLKHRDRILAKIAAKTAINREKLQELILEEPKDPNAPVEGSVVIKTGDFMISWD